MWQHHDVEWDVAAGHVYGRSPNLINDVTFRKRNWIRAVVFLIRLRIQNLWIYFLWPRPLGKYPDSSKTETFLPPLTGGGISGFRLFRGRQWDPGAFKKTVKDLPCTCLASSNCRIHANELIQLCLVLDVKFSLAYQGGLGHHWGSGQSTPIC